MTDEPNTKTADAIPAPHDGVSREMTLREYIENTLPAGHRARQGEVGALAMRIASDNPVPARVAPYCKTCGWRKGGKDSWDGKACKCGHDEPLIQTVEEHTGTDDDATGVRVRIPTS